MSSRKAGLLVVCVLGLGLSLQAAAAPSKNKSRAEKTKAPSAQVQPSLAPVASTSPCFDLSVTKTIPFTAKDIHVGNESMGDMLVLGGTIPGNDGHSSGTYGSLIVGMPAFPSPELAKSGNFGYFAGSRSDKSKIELWVDSSEAQPGQTTFSGGGLIVLGDLLHARLKQMTNPDGEAVPVTAKQAYDAAPTKSCVSGIAISLTRRMYGSYHLLYMGTVYIYLNDGKSSNFGLAVDF